MHVLYPIYFLKTYPFEVSCLHFMKIQFLCECMARKNFDKELFETNFVISTHGVESEKFSKLSGRICRNKSSLINRPVFNFFKYIIEDEDDPEEGQVRFAKEFFDKFKDVPVDNLTIYIQSSPLFRKIHDSDKISVLKHDDFIEFSKLFK